jgi:hyperosmotically inducible periplasmic protein
MRQNTQMSHAGRLAIAAALLGATLIVSAQTPPNPPTPNTPPTTPPSNAQIAEDSATTMKVKSALLADSDLQSVPIEVQTTNGSVRLNGVVATSALKERARQVASQVAGVKSIDNQLVVKTA